jgi:hypothetical protein
MFYVSRRFIYWRRPLRDKNALKLSYERLGFQNFSGSNNSGPLGGEGGVWGEEEIICLQS